VGRGLYERNGTCAVVMNILAIEASCDETAAAIVKDGTEVLSNVVASSAEMHAKTGGIIPETAARQQVKSIMPVVDEAMSFAKVTQNEIDKIAVTVGPGLIGSLLVGVETAKTLARLWNKPVIPVNHMMGHVYACFLEQEGKEYIVPIFPAIALVVSGGHTDLIYMKGHGETELIGTTRDDAAGECFDKCARLLGLPYPGGPSISKAAEEYLMKNLGNRLDLLPRPMISAKGRHEMDWSFSGLKTAVLNRVKSAESINAKEVQRLAAEIQEAICDVLVSKSLKAVRKYEPKSFLLSGGVAANRNLREKFADEFSHNLTGITLHVPEPKYCTDNAAMIGAAAYYLQGPASWESVFVDPQLSTTG